MARRGILVISHGSRDAGWVRLVDEAVQAAARALPTEVPVFASYLELVEGRLIQDGIDALTGQGVSELLALPLFVSSGSTHIDDIGQALGLPPVAPGRAGDLAPMQLRGARITYGEPMNDDPALTELLLAHLAELSENPQQEQLLLVAHGSKERVFHGRWRALLRQLAARLQAAGGFARVEGAMLLPNQAACVLQAMQRRAPERPVLVVPLFLSEGYFTRTVIPQRLQGLDYRYNGRTILPSAFAVEWLQRRMNEWLEDAQTGNGAE